MHCVECLILQCKTRTRATCGRCADRAAITVGREWEKRQQIITEPLSGVQVCSYYQVDLSRGLSEHEVAQVGVQLLSWGAPPQHASALCTVCAWQTPLHLLQARSKYGKNELEAEKSGWLVTCKPPALQCVAPFSPCLLGRTGMECFAVVFFSHCTARATTAPWVSG